MHKDKICPLILHFVSASKDTSMFKDILSLAYFYIVVNNSNVGNLFIYLLRSLYSDSIRAGWTGDRIDILHPPRAVLGHIHRPIKRYRAILRGTGARAWR